MLIVIDLVRLIHSQLTQGQLKIILDLSRQMRKSKEFGNNQQLNNELFNCALYSYDNDTSSYIRINYVFSFSSTKKSLRQTIIYILYFVSLHGDIIHHHHSPLYSHLFHLLLLRSTGVTQSFLWNVRFEEFLDSKITV